MAQVFLVLICLCCFEAILAKNKLIVVLIDGCRWNFIDDPDLDLKGFRKIEETGVRASAVNPVYPALSYPNWYSIVTGLYPESHGFINNIMFDKESGSSFLMLPNKGSTDPHWWNVAEPIWVTAEKEKRTAALYWWAGCEVPIKGVEPMICERHRYDAGTEAQKRDFLERVDDVIEMFEPTREDQLSLAMMYYGPLDYTGHYSGPQSSENRRALKDIDDLLYGMLDKLEESGLRDEVNVMIVSDHGMVDLTNPPAIYISLEKFAPYIKHQVSTGATSMLVAEDGMLDKLYKELQDANITGIKVFLKEDIPASFHLKESPRMNDIFIKAEKGYLIEGLNDSRKRIGYPPERYKGTHGFDPDEVEDMKTIFLATGPNFRKGYKLEEISNVDIYNVMCSVLQIVPLPNNGSSLLVSKILDNPESSAFHRSAESLSTSPFSLMSHLIIVLFIMFNTSMLHICEQMK